MDIGNMIIINVHLLAIHHMYQIYKLDILIQIVHIIILINKVNRTKRITIIITIRIQ